MIVTTAYNYSLNLFKFHFQYSSFKDCITILKKRGVAAMPTGTL